VVTSTVNARAALIDRRLSADETAAACCPEASKKRIISNAHASVSNGAEKGRRP
jgi:hypothetical protein